MQMARYLVKADFTEKTVVSSRGLMAGGDVGAIVYTRSRRNMITSPGLLRRMNIAAAGMKANCTLPDHCTSDPRRAGKMMPDGKIVRLCTPEECSDRLRSARECAIRTLSA